MGGSKSDTALSEKQIQPKYSNSSAGNINLEFTSYLSADFRANVCARAFPKFEYLAAQQAHLSAFSITQSLS
jgi:hypothetical protein